MLTKSLLLRPYTTSENKIWIIYPEVVVATGHSQATPVEEILGL